jgi:NADH-quinone oxidoreductase subunit D
MVMLSETRTESGKMILNMGPQHPSTHGVLRLLLELEGETVVSCVPDIGFLHTGIEKTMEARNYHQAIVLTDRTDYLSPLTNNLSYILACEKLFEIEAEVPTRAQVVRVIMCELSRIGSHLIWLGTHALDLGATTVFLYCWREREQILSINELVSGVRMMTSYFRIGGLAADVPAEFAERVEAFARAMPGRVDEYELLLSRNPIFMDRTRGIGTVSREEAIKYGMSGPCLRGSGIPFDIRVAYPYCGYEQYQFDVPFSNEGDVYARYMVRVQEMRESVRIIRQGLEMLRGLQGAPIRVDNPRIAFPKRDKIHTSMESLIHHFKLVSEGPVPPAGEAYATVESPRGELGTYVFSDGSNKPHRVRFRAPGFYNLQALPQLTAGRLVADVVACIGSIDIVLGEIDR